MSLAVCLVYVLWGSKPSGSEQWQREGFDIAFIFWETSFGISLCPTLTKQSPSGLSALVRLFHFGWTSEIPHKVSQKIQATSNPSSRHCLLPSGSSLTERITRQYAQWRKIYYDVIRLNADFDWMMSLWPSASTRSYCSKEDRVGGRCSAVRRCKTNAISGLPSFF